jgi:hypothetical protein
MAVVEETPYASSIANGVTTVFPHSFTVEDEADLRVIGTLAGVVTEYQNGVDFTISGLGDPSGSVTFVAAPASGTIVVRYRDTSLSRDTDYQNNGDLLAPVVNDDFDRIWRALQDIFNGGKGPPTAIRVPPGEVVDALPIAADRASRVLAFDSNGDPIMIVGVDATSAAALQIDLASAAAINKGAGQIGYVPTLNYVGQTVGARLNDLGVSPMSLGATGDGVADDISYINACFLYSNTVDLRNRAWAITDPIVPPAGSVVLADGASITMANGADPGISFAGALDGLTIRGGLWNGTCGAWLSLTSADTTPSVEADYARQIRIEGVHVTSTTIARAIDMTNAVRKVFIDTSVFFTVSGINASGKCVEIKVSKSIIYSSTGAAGSYGVKMRSPAGGGYFNEGWHFTDCTVDNFEKSFDVTDIFALTCTAGYYGATAGNYAFDFGDPTTTACNHITLTGFTCAGKIRFAPTGGQLYHAVLSSLIFAGVTGSSIQIADNAAGIRIANVKGENSTTGVLVECVSNNANIVIDGVDVDSTYVRAVEIKGAAGDDCAITNVGFDGSGDAIYIERAVLLKGIPVHSANVAAHVINAVGANLGGGATYAVAAAIATIAVAYAKGETGDILVQLPYSGANAATQNVQITLPAGMATITGTGYSALNLFTGAAAGLLFARVPYYCTAAGSGNVVVTNQAGNTLTVANQGYCAVIKDC